MLDNRRKLSLFEKFVQMIKHVKLIKSERCKYGLGESGFKRAFDLLKKLLNFIFLVTCIVLYFITDGVVIIYKPLAPVFEQITMFKNFLTLFI